MTKMHLSTLLPSALALIGVVNGVKTFMLDCTNCPDSCNNDCYGVFVLGFSDTLNYDNPTEAVEDSRRRATGCTQSNGDSACGVNGVAPYNSAGDSCDEYPYASTQEGGTAGAALRCVSQSDNSSEGAQLGNFFADPVDGCGGAPCEFLVFQKTGTYDGAPFCKNMGGANDGNEFKLSNGMYVDAKIKIRKEDGIYMPHVPNPADIFPMYLRREFELSNGERVLLRSRDMVTPFINTTMWTQEGPLTIVRELFGEEKSPEFRPVTRT